MSECHVLGHKDTLKSATIMHDNKCRSDVLQITMNPLLFGS